MSDEEIWRKLHLVKAVLVEQAKLLMPPCAMLEFDAWKAAFLAPNMDIARVEYLWDQIREALDRHHIGQLEHKI